MVNQQTLIITTKCSGAERKKNNSKCSTEKAFLSILIKPTRCNLQFPIRIFSSLSTIFCTWPQHISRAHLECSSRDGQIHSFDSNLYIYDHQHLKTKSSLTGVINFQKQWQQKIPKNLVQLRCFIIHFGIMGRNRIETARRTDPGGAYMRSFQESALAAACCPSWLRGADTRALISDIITESENKWNSI